MRRGRGCLQQTKDPQVRCTMKNAFTATPTTFDCKYALITLAEGKLSVSSQPGLDRAGVFRNRHSLASTTYLIY